LDIAHQSKDRPQDLKEFTKVFVVYLQYPKVVIMN